MHNAIVGNNGPALGEAAPCFETKIGESTINLKDYRGNWVIIFSHPEDLLPVFKTRTMNYVLCKRKIKAVALGDSHTAEMYSCRSFLKKYIVKYSLAVIDDSGGQIAGSFGLHNGNGNGDKGVFVIDRQGILRGKLFSPHDKERDFSELLKLVDALQAADRQKVLHPVRKTWKNGWGIVIKQREKVISKQGI